MLFKKKKVLFFVPHQDDELLTMGAAISRAAEKYEVHVILCTDGSGSGVRAVLNDGKSCAKHKGSHCYDLTEKQFIAARDAEFVESCCALGVERAKVHIPMCRVRDGELSVMAAEEIVRLFVIMYGGSSLVCTISPTNGPDQHQDHRNLGAAVNNLLHAGRIQRAEFFVEPYLFGKIADNPRLIPIEPTVYSATERTADRMSKAAEAYSRWNPEKERFAVGYHSVAAMFNAFAADMKSYGFIKCHEGSMTLRDRLHQQNRKWLKLNRQRQLYYSSGRCERPELGDMKLVCFRPGETEAYSEFCTARGIPVREAMVQRLRDGSFYFGLTDAEGAVVSSGWMAYRQHFYVGETDFAFDMAHSDAAVLYNFTTDENHRGKGYYGLLLRAIAGSGEAPERYIIYTSPDNSSSSKGVLKAGFTQDGVFCAEDGSLERYLKDASFTSIRRKYRLKGLVKAK